MNLTIIAASISAAISFGSAWTIQSWRFNAKELDRAIQNTADQKSRFVQFEASQSRTILAQNKAATEILALRRDVAASGDAASGLRDILASATLRAASASHEATREYVVVANEVLGSCQREYLDMAEKAEGHAIDARLFKSVD